VKCLFITLGSASKMREATPRICGMGTVLERKLDYFYLYQDGWLETVANSAGCN
jgi:hypothetical protein